MPKDLAETVDGSNLAWGMDILNGKFDRLIRLAKDHPDDPLPEDLDIPTALVIGLDWCPDVIEAGFRMNLMTGRTLRTESASQQKPRCRMRWGFLAPIDLDTSAPNRPLRLPGWSA